MTCDQYETCSVRQTLIKIVSEGSHRDMATMQEALKVLRENYCGSGEQYQCPNYRAGRQ